MKALQISIPVTELNRRMRTRLGGSDTAPRVVWQDGQQRVLIHLDSLKVRGANGWLLCHIELETDPTKRQRLQILYFLGRDGEGDGIGAGSSINAATAASARLADRWGRDLQRVMWDAVLDGIEVGVQHMKRENAGSVVKLHGFTCDKDELHVRVLAGDF